EKRPAGPNGSHANQNATALKSNVKRSLLGLWPITWPEWWTRKNFCRLRNKRLAGELVVTVSHTIKGATGFGQILGQNV
ncbi:hypothetical protein, partial [Mesorhizobium sp.]|uniref:hypothetical protein n=1 Tax=Mesorhizobium sp. TaxID=1871066 RepID=UPI002580B5CC